MLPKKKRTVSVYKKIREDAYSFLTIFLISAIIALDPFHFTPSTRLLLCLLIALLYFTDQVRWLFLASRFYALGYASQTMAFEIDETEFLVSLKPGTKARTGGMALLRIEVFIPEARTLLGPLVAATTLVPVRHFIYENSVVLYFEFEASRNESLAFTSYEGLPSAPLLKRQLEIWSKNSLIRA